ncbi:transient receptor potential cation channel protein painless-like [Calliphora vicina]|uniref:transient receptor potential cation channel protein painless-like n=1 Tax=Calliphora vicina TaxID=7373 RepID=UPI00325BC5F9
MQNNYKPVDLTSSLIDPQIKLSKALINRDIAEFRDALSIGAHAQATDDQNLSIFEKTLQTPGCSEFVKECLRSGCDANYVNKFYKKAAINFASDSRDPQNLTELLSSPGVKTDYKYSGLTPLNSLAKNINNENANNVIECIKILLVYGASPNEPDQREMTPLHNVIRNHKLNEMQKYELVQLFLALPNIDIDTYREGELRSVLETEYPLMELPGRKVNNIITFHTLLTHIRNDNMDMFKQQYTDKSRNTSEDEELQLFVAAIEKGAHTALDLILANGVDYNSTVKGNNSPIEIAWIYGNWYALEKLLQQPDIRIRPKDHPLSNIVCKLNEDSVQEFCNYWKCFYVLLNSDKIDINATDFSKSTALHYAVKYRNNKAIKELLKRGACICLENRFHELPLNGMNPSVWEDHLDDCVSSSDHKLGDKDFEILISFKNFMSTPQKGKDKGKEHLKEVLSPIAFMAKSKEYRYLLQHPVITSILYLKWHKLSLIFYVNFLAYMFFAISILSHTVLKFRQIDLETARNISRYCSYVGISYLSARECIQLIVSPLKYIKSITNYLEILLIILSILTCQDSNENLELQRNLAVACILLLAYELVLLVGSLPISSISTHMLMLEAVCISFVKSFLLYSIFIFTFALCFYIKSDNQGEKSDEEFHKFSDPLVAFSKTIVMFTGEFDAGALNLDTVYNYLLFLSFVFFMTIILFNLLNGLAVSDTQAIKDQAELNEIICRTQLLYRYERAVYKQAGNFTFLLKRQPFKLICKILAKLFPDYTTDIQISIMPNDKNKVFGPKTTKKLSVVQVKNFENGTNVVNLAESDYDDDDNDDNDAFTRNKYLKCWFSCISNNCSRIDERTVNQAMQVLEKKSNESIESRLEGMEEKLIKIMNCLKIDDSETTECN